MDIAKTIEPRSDQQNYDDVAIAPRTVTVTEVRGGSAEQPVELHLEEFPGRPYKPSKSMRRVLVAAWGSDGSKYVGRRLTIYGDPDVKFGGERVGGIKISHLSHIEKRMSMPLTVTRGKRVLHTVEPLRDDAPTPRQGRQRPATPDVDTIDDVETLRAMWQSADAATRKRIEARVAALQQQPTPATETPFDDTEWIGGEPA
jgi:hypothetical protein